MKKNKGLGFYLLVCALLALVAGLLIPGRTAMLKGINGLFCGGLAVFLLGLFRLVCRMGIFDLFLYSHQKLRQYSKRYKEEHPDEEQKVGAYHEYLQQKEVTTHHRAPLAAGGLFIALSVVISLLLY